MLRDYICPECGGKMEFEDSNEDILICPSCGNSMELDEYGSDPYENLYPTKEELEDFDLELGEIREVYDEVNDELHRD